MSTDREQDNIWKEILDSYFQDFLAFFFPAIHQDIDWGRGYEFLDKELEKVVRDSEIGRRLVDKLVKVYLVDGQETLLLIHIEVQGYPDPHFEERMFIYNYRIFDRYHAPVVSLALLTDVNENYRPSYYELKRWGFEHTFRFPAIKLIDYNSDWTALEANPNPFAVVVMANLKVQQERGARKDFQNLLAWKLRLVRMLYERQYNRQQILELFRFIDWIVRLPVDLEQAFRAELVKYEEEGKMPYVTSIERLGREEGREEGRKQEAATLLLRQLRRRFGEITPESEQRLNSLSIEKLEELGEALLDFAKIEELQSWLDKQEN